MRKGTIEYIEYVENGIKEEFKIICVSSCNGEIGNPVSYVDRKQIENNPKWVRI